MASHIAGRLRKKRLRERQRFYHILHREGFHLFLRRTVALDDTVLHKGKKKIGVDSDDSCHFVLLIAIPMEHGI